MATVTTRPSATLFDSSWARTGGATAHGVLADNSDATYLTGNFYDAAWFTFATPSIPAGAVIRAIQPRVRLKSDAFFGRMEIAGFVGTAPSSQGFPSSGSTIFRHSLAPPTTISTITTGEAAGSSVPYVRIYAPGIGSVLLYEAYLDFLTVARPLTDVVETSGVITTTNLPLIRWENTLEAEGGPQTFFEVKLYGGTTHGAFGAVDPDTTPSYLTSGITASGSDRWTSTQPLPNDTWRAYVRVAQTVNGALHWSAWDWINFEVDVLEPGVPTLAVVGENAQGRVKLSITATTGETPTDSFQAQVLRDGAWETLPGGEPANTGSTVDVYDFRVANGETRSYRVRALAEPITYSDFASDTGSWASGDAWLKHGSLAGLNTVITVRDYTGPNRDARGQVFQPLGRADGVGVFDTERGLQTGQLVLIVEGAAIDPIDALLDTGDPVLIQCPPAWDEPDRWVRFGSDSRERAAAKSFVHHRFVSLAWTEVAEPTEETD